MASKKKTASRSKKTTTPTAAKATEPKGKHCKNCKCEQIPGATFCHHCGVPQ